MDSSRLLSLLALASPPTCRLDWSVPLDEVSFTQLAVEVSPRLYRIAYRICGDASLADDAVQDAFLRLLRSQPKLESYAHAQNWLVRVLRQRSITIVRGRKELLVARIPEDAGRMVPDRQPCEQAEFVRVIRDAIARLSDRQALAIELSLEDKTQEQIATEMGCTRSTVDTHLREAHAKLDRMLRSQGFAPMLAVGALAGIPIVAKCDHSQLVAIIAHSWERAADPAVKLAPLGWSVAQKWLAGLVAMGVMTAGGVGLVMVKSEGEKPVAAKSPIVVMETLAIKNTRYFYDKIAQPLLTSLESMAVGGGKSRILEVTAIDSRLRVRVGVRHNIRLPDRLEEVEVVFGYDTAALRLTIFNNQNPKGEWRLVDLKDSILWLRVPKLGIKIESRPEAMDNIAALFHTLPKDETATWFVGPREAALRSDLAAYVGMWASREQPGRKLRCELLESFVMKFTSNEDPPQTLVLTADELWACERGTVYRSELPGGPLAALQISLTDNPQVLRFVPTWPYRSWRRIADEGKP